MRTANSLPGAVASWVRTQIAAGRRVYYTIEDPDGVVDSVPAVSPSGTPLINDAESTTGQPLMRYRVRAEVIPHYVIPAMETQLPESNNLYIWAAGWRQPGLIWPTQNSAPFYTDGTDEDSAFYTTPTEKYRRVCVTPDNGVFPQSRITGFSSGQDKAIIAAVAIAAAGYYAYGGGAGSGAAAGAGAEIAGPVAETAPAAGGMTGAGEITAANVGKAAAGVLKDTAAVVKGATQLAGAVATVAAAATGSGSGTEKASATGDKPTTDNSIYYIAAVVIVALGVM